MKKDKINIRFLRIRRYIKISLSKFWPKFDKKYPKFGPIIADSSIINKKLMEGAKK